MDRSFCKIERDNIWEELLRVTTKILNIKTSDEVLGSIRVEYDGSSLSFMLSDHQNFISAEFSVIDGQGNFELLAEISSFYSAIKRAKRGSIITISHVGNSIIITSDNAETVVPIQDDTMYPLPLFDFPSFDYSFSAEDFKKAVSVTAPAIKNNVLSARLKVIHINSTGIESTNGLSAHRSALIKTRDGDEFFIPFNTVLMLVELIKGSSADTIFLASDKDFLYFKIGSIYFMHIASFSRFPDVDGILREAKHSNTTQVYADARELEWAFNYVCDSPKIVTEAIQITLRSNTLEFRINDFAEVTSTVAVSYTGPSATVNVDRVLLGVFLKTIKTGQTLLSFPTGNLRAPLYLANNEHESLIIQVV